MGRVQRRRRRGPAAILAFVALAACTGAGPSGGNEPDASPPPPATSAPARGSDTVRLQPPPGGSFLVRGTYPPVDSACVRSHQPRLRARYPGRLTIRRVQDGGISLEVSLPFERYLEGIAEVPPSWPRATLEAQAIAARSYALATTGWDGPEGGELEQPICSTTACQVYRGLPIGRVGDTRRWFRAVRATAGQVLVFQGRPAETVYFSTSNGGTYGNEDVFGSDPLPYLRPVVERDDGASPTSHWQARLPLRDVAAFLAAADRWPERRPIGSVRGNGDRVTIHGGGRSRTLAGSDFRDAVNAWAPCLRPGTYPQDALPSTIPSRWMTVESDRGVAVVTGRGWGHGVGMVQWGAYGKARRGFSAERILSFYYGGLRPQPFPEPGLIHVEITSGLTGLRIVPSDPGASMAGEELGVGPIVVRGGDALTVRPSPDGG